MMQMKVSTVWQEEERTPARRWEEHVKQANYLVLTLLACALCGMANAEYVVDSVATGSGPFAIAVNPITNRIYVANVNGDNMTVVDGATDSVFVVPTDTQPWAVAVNPVTNRVYVANYGMNTVTVIDGATSAETRVAVGRFPNAIAVNPVTNQVYVANLSDSTVTVIDGTTNATRTIFTGAEPRAIAVNPATNRIYVANYNGANPGSVTIINGATDSTLSAPVGDGPVAVAVNPVTNRVYVANYQAPNTVSVIDGTTGDSLATVLTGNQPHCIAVDPVANQIYVACVFGNCVSVIDGATNAVSTVVTQPQPGWLALDPLANLIYVADQNDVSVIDGATQALTIVAGLASAPALAVSPVTGRLYVADHLLYAIHGTRDSMTAVSADANPMAEAVNPVTDKIYVANRGSSDVTLIDGATNGTQTVTAGSSPSAVAVNPVTDKVYVANSGSNSVTVINGATNDTASVAVGSGPQAVAVNPVTNKVYVANFGSDSVTVIDGATNGALAVAVGMFPGAMAVNPATNKVYVATSGTGGNSIAVIDGATNAVRTVTVGNGPMALAVNPVTNRIFVANLNSNSVSVIDGSSDTVIATPSVGLNPQAVAVNPATNRVYVANYNNSVSVIDGASITVIATPVTGTDPIALAVNTVTNQVYVANSGSINLTVIDGATNDTQTVMLGSGGRAVAVNPVTGKFYIPFGSSQVAVIWETPARDTKVRAVMNQLPGDTTSLAHPTLTGRGVNRSSPGQTEMLAVGNRLNTAQQAWNKAGILSGAGTDSLTWVFDWGSDSLVMGENFIVLQPLEADAGTTNNLGLGTPFAGNLEVYPIYRIGTAAPETSWTPAPPIPNGPKGKTVKDGGCMASDGLGNLYLLKGNNTTEFYRYSAAADTWYTGDSIPRLDPDGKKHPVKKGASMTVVGGSVYVLKGGNSRVYWHYGPGAVEGTNSWVAGEAGDILTWSSQASAANYDYTLAYDKQLKATVFSRFTPGGTQKSLASLTPPPGSPTKTGSCIVYYPDELLGRGLGSGRIFALAGATNAFAAYDIDRSSWTTKNSMPLYGRSGQKKKVGAGAGMAYHSHMIYALKGNSTLEFWTYNDASTQWLQGDDVPVGDHRKKIKGGASIAYVPGLGELCIAKGNNTNEFYYVTVTGSKAGLTPGAGLQSAGSNPGLAFGLTVEPNPMARDARVSFSVPRAGDVGLRLYDVTGRLVSVLVSGGHPAGSYSSQLTANSSPQKLAAGVYVLQLDCENYRTTKKLIIE